jgi:imidazolonepropionase
MSVSYIINIKTLAGIREDNRLLCGKQLAELPAIHDAYLVTEDDEIAAYGSMAELEIPQSDLKKAFDARGRLVLPAWCDSHTHLVFPASREEEFIDKIKGLSYADIAARGGGILHSAKKLAAMSEEKLFTDAWQRLTEVSRMGTGAIEIKSGYGLSVEGELKILRVIKKLKEKSNLLIKSTFLGAHTYPPEYKENHQGYMDLLINEMLPVIARENLADYIDVFCETGFFSPAETEIICKAGRQYGLKPKLHVNQLSSIGGIETGLKLQALSLDHLETLTEQDLQRLSENARNENAQKTVCTLLPTAAFFLRMPYQPARSLIDAGCAVALASDFNPGSSPSGNMNFVVSLACIGMRMLPEEALNAATLNGAFAMEMQGQCGSISRGKKANLIVTEKIPSLAYLPYAFGQNHIHNVMICGNWLYS